MRLKSPGTQYQISVDGVPRTYRDRQDIALQTARFLKSRNPNSIVKRPPASTLVLVAPGMRTSNQVATLDEAKAEFEASWKRWKKWAELRETTN